MWPHQPTRAIWFDAAAKLLFVSEIAVPRMRTGRNSTGSYGSPQCVAYHTRPVWALGPCGSEWYGLKQPGDNPCGAREFDVTGASAVTSENWHSPVHTPFMRLKPFLHCLHSVWRSSSWHFTQFSTRVVHISERGNEPKGQNYIHDIWNNPISLNKRFFFYRIVNNTALILTKKLGPE